MEGCFNDPGFLASTMQVRAGLRKTSVASSSSVPLKHQTIADSPVLLGVFLGPHCPSSGGIRWFAFVFTSGSMWSCTGLYSFCFSANLLLDYVTATPSLYESLGCGCGLCCQLWPVCLRRRFRSGNTCRTKLKTRTAFLTTTQRSSSCCYLIFLFETQTMLKGFLTNCIRSGTHIL